MIRKIFDVIIRDKPYSVFDIEGKEHESYNGQSSTWWLYFADSLPADLLPPIDSEHWVPYTRSINRLVWDLRFKEYNSVKYKWDEYRFSNGVSCEMYCNNKLVYTFGVGGSIEFAMSKAGYLMIKLVEHSYNFLEPEKEKGRKIWWYGLPAFVSPKTNGWEIGIIPDYSTGIDRQTWWDEFKKRRSNINEVVDPNDINIWDDEDEGSDYINWGDALSDGHIGWFRK